MVKQLAQRPSANFLHYLAIAGTTGGRFVAMVCSAAWQIGARLWRRLSRTKRVVRLPAPKVEVVEYRLQYDAVGNSPETLEALLELFRKYAKETLTIGEGKLSEAPPVNVDRFWNLLGTPHSISIGTLVEAIETNHPHWVTAVDLGVAKLVLLGVLRESYSARPIIDAI